MEDAEKNFDITSGRGDFKGAVVGVAGVEPERQGQILNNEVREANAAGEGIEETADDKEQGFERFDGILKFKEFFVDLRGCGEIERADFVGLGGIEKLKAGGTETFSDFVLTQREEGGDVGDAPTPEDVREFGCGREIFEWQ